MYLADTFQAPEMVNPLLDHAIFASFFPYLTAGPIFRLMEVVPQFKTFTAEGSRLELAARGALLLCSTWSRKWCRRTRWSA